ncbi:MAG TPA: enolase C-terminal domain-like protein [Burkholderiales bacterium]|jgi:mandelate racemase|nr:enolase C-terminal domain-like protein [Burkholderiales bacterium]
MNAPPLTVRAIRAVAVEVPLRFVLGTSAAAVRAAPLLLVDVETEEGITGRTYLFCYVRAAAPAIVSLLSAVEAAVKGQRVVPAERWAQLAKQFRLIGVQGVVRMAMSAFDTACWDALAIAANVPLVEYLGGARRPIPAYNSCGLGLMPAAALADEAEQLLEGGFGAVKLRLGYPTLAEDIAALHAVRARVPAAIRIMVDFNQALSVDEALKRGRALDGEGVYWIEEPIRHDDYRGAATLARELVTPIQIGENFSEPHSMAEALEMQACDYAMPDLERIGGVTGWRGAAALAAARTVPMSSHLFPEVSAHLLAVTPTAHWLEYVDWAGAIVEEPLAIVAGHAVIPARPGNGLAWNKEAVGRYRMK